MKLNLFTVFLVIAFFGTVLTADPPQLHPNFQIAFDQTYYDGAKKFIVNGQMFYDAKNNRERYDRTSGSHNLFCGSVLPNVTTPCTHLTVNNKRYIHFPNKKQCCFCCDSEHGCGILKQDWLSDAKFIGQQKLIDTFYDKWSKDGDFGYNYFYVTSDDSHIPRRLDENGTHVTDYIVHSYMQKQFDDSIFALPSYCDNSCPLTSICGQFRDENNLKKE